jgi:hypothetical protein
VWNDPELTGALWVWGAADEYSLVGYDAEIMCPQEISWTEGEQDAYFGQAGLQLPALFAPQSPAVGNLLLDWVPATNRYQIADAPTVISISQSLIDTHDGDPDAHPTFARASDLGAYALTNSLAAVATSGLYSDLTGTPDLAGYAPIETAVTGAVTTATSGYRYYWQTATNVTLTAALTDAQVVNLAILRNTATNSVTAIGTAGWVWTGGAMTNTIPAGRMMTFGWAHNPMSGLTNAYATAASEN